MSADTEHASSRTRNGTAHLRWSKPFLVLGALLTGASWQLPAAGAQGAVETGRFGDWALHQSEGTEQKVCFAATQPKEKDPPGANRSAILLYVSTWPKEGVKSEVSVKLGYPIKPDSPVTVTIGNDQFTLFPKDERAFVADQTEELKLIEAMKKGSTLLVQATSQRGTPTRDTYSLAGISGALQAMAASCP